MLAVSQATSDEAIEHLGETISTSETWQCARVIARTRVPEGRGHLQGRAVVQPKAHKQLADPPGAARGCGHRWPLVVLVP